MKDSKYEVLRIIHTAAKLIRSDIKSMNSLCDNYPSTEQMADSGAALKYLPDTLQAFLQVLFTGKNTEMKRASVGQAIMQGTRPRIILAPLQFGLALEMHHTFSSRFIVDTLNKHGFGCSYAEIQRFEHSAALQWGELPDHRTGQVIQFVADNARRPPVPYSRKKNSVAICLVSIHKFTALVWTGFISEGFFKAIQRGTFLRIVLEIFETVYIILFTHVSTIIFFHAQEF